MTNILDYLGQFSGYSPEDTNFFLFKWRDGRIDLVPEDEIGQYSIRNNLSIALSVFEPTSEPIIPEYLVEYLTNDQARKRHLI